MKPTRYFQREFVFGRSGRAAYRTAALVWAAVLLIASLQPKRPPNFHFSVAHHVVHFLCFGALAFLATVGFGNLGRTSPLPAAATFLFGFTIEFLQHLQNRQSIEWYDVLDDAVGILAFAAFCYVESRRTADAKRVPVRVNELVP
jgi:hypothetical protein